MTDMDGGAMLMHKRSAADSELGFEVCLARAGEAPPAGARVDRKARRL